MRKAIRNGIRDMELIALRALLDVSLEKTKFENLFNKKVGVTYERHQRMVITFSAKS